MAIRVTPIGGGPIELSEDTACVGALAPFGAVTGISGDLLEIRLVDGTFVIDEIRTLGAVCDGRFRDAFVRIGDAWLLCEVETWRLRAERLERELAAVRMQLWAADALHPPENDRLAMERWKAGRL